MSREMTEFDYFRPIALNVHICKNPRTTDIQRELFFQKFETFGLGQTNWAEILGGILAISSQTIGTILAL